MLQLFIHATNSSFRSSDQGAQYERPEDALAFGVRSAVAMLADEISQGEHSAAVEISVRREDGTQMLRSIVSVAVAKLLPDNLDSKTPDKST